ncbi:hypothetical protein, partial [uncultured Allobaculum sp.]|uniref:hypothetical protein n=1 Tax=uncultured Allobaculum sp. TaxID=1187017 RepID=UPI0025973D5A
MEGAQTIQAPIVSRIFASSSKTASNVEKSPNDIGFLLYLSGDSSCSATSYLCLAAIVGVLQLNDQVRYVSGCILQAIATILRFFEWIFQ